VAVIKQVCTRMATLLYVTLLLLLAKYGTQHPADTPKSENHEVLNQPSLGCAEYFLTVLSIGLGKCHRNSTLHIDGNTAVPRPVGNKIPYSYTLLTPWNIVLLEKLTDSQPVKKFPASYGTRRFITTFTSARRSEARVYVS
jgi:hypothetical protein